VPRRCGTPLPDTRRADGSGQLELLYAGKPGWTPLGHPMTPLESEEPLIEAGARGRSLTAENHHFEVARASAGAAGPVRPKGPTVREGWCRPNGQ